jgi:uncharacterized protein
MDGKVDCLKCGTCGTAPDISSLDKPLGTACIHLDPGGLCKIYAERPAVCQWYQPDELCRQIAAPTLGERVERYLALFGMQGLV